MSLIDRDRLHRTAKILLDGGHVDDLDSARSYLDNLVMQVHVGPRIGEELAAQAALLTAVNAGRRAMLGGVRAVIENDCDPRLSLPWARGHNLTDAIRLFGGEVTDQLDPSYPVLTIGNPLPRQRLRRQVCVHASWHGWCGGVTDSTNGHFPGDAMPLAGVVAGALGVSEIFQHLLGSDVAGRRAVGVSLWRPDLHWQVPEAAGPALQYLPTGLWLLGLGHLGQANVWSLGCLPYRHPEDLDVYLVDFDKIVEANQATGLLTDQADIGLRKTRVVASRVEGLGHRTRLIERRFDQNLIPGQDEPSLALAGFDAHEPRRQLGDKFRRVVDAGLGAGPTDYLDILIHTFPSQLTPKEAFPSGIRADRPLGAVYEAEISRRESAGAEPGTARCGVVELAGAAAAAAFVGATAASLAVADLLRLLHGGQQYAVLGVDLRSPGEASVAMAETPEPDFNPGYTSVRSDIARGLP